MLNGSARLRFLDADLVLDQNRTFCGVQPSRKQANPGGNEGICGRESEPGRAYDRDNAKHPRRYGGRFQIEIQNIYANMASYQTDKDALELDDLPPDYVSSRDSVKDSVNYAEKLVTQDLHPAFADSRISYDPNNDCFAAEEEDTYDESVLFDNQRAFADALEQFQQGVKPKYKSQIDLQATHTWSEVMKQADEARSKYTGVGQQGVIKRINHGLKSFQTAAPAIQAWLKLLPSNTTYGSIICGGLTVILEVCPFEQRCCKTI